MMGYYESYCRLTDLQNKLGVLNIIEFDVKYVIKPTLGFQNKSQFCFNLKSTYKMNIPHRNPSQK